MQQRTEIAGKDQRVGKSRPLEKSKGWRTFKESVSNEEEQNSKFPFCAYNCILSVNTAESPLTWLP